MHSTKKMTSEKDQLVTLSISGLRVINYERGPGRFFSVYLTWSPRRNVQLRLTGNLGLQSGILWLRIKSEDKCLLCSIENEDIIHFVSLRCRYIIHFVSLRCRYFFNDWKSFWYRLRQVVLASSDGDAQTFLLFVKNLDNVLNLNSVLDFVRDAGFLSHCNFINK